MTELVLRLGAGSLWTAAYWVTEVLGWFYGPAGAEGPMARLLEARLPESVVGLLAAILLLRVLCPLLSAL